MSRAPKAQSLKSTGFLSLGRPGGVFLNWGLFSAFGVFAWDGPFGILDDVSFNFQLSTYYTVHLVLVII